MSRSANYLSMVLAATLAGCAGVSVNPNDWVAQSIRSVNFDQASEECTRAANEAISLDGTSITLIGAMVVGALVGSSSPQAGLSSMNGYIDGAHRSGADQTNGPTAEEILQSCMRSNGWRKQ